MTRQRSISASLLAAAVLVATVAGCSSSPSGPKEDDLALDAGAHANIIITQIAVDTEGLDFGEMNRTVDIMVKGIVTETPGFVSWYAGNQAMPLSKATNMSIGDEQLKITATLRRLPSLQSASDRKHHVPALTPEEAARVIIASELLDARYLTPADLPGALDANHAVTAGTALDTWYTAHADQPLAPGSSVTLATEATRIVAEINRPEPS